MNKENLLVLVSGGRSSARMAHHIHNSEEYNSQYNILYVFCNTGMERLETIDFLKNIVNVWGISLTLIEGVYSTEQGVGVKHKIVDFDELDMSGRVFSEMIAHVNKNKNIGVPNQAVPYCSDYLKTRPSHHFAKSIFGNEKYVKALGYRLEDMPKRITFAELREDKSRIAPLLTDFEKPIDRIDLTRFFKSQPFKLEIESRFGNCELCWKKSTSLLINCIQQGTRFIQWHKEQELKYKNMFFRENMSIDQLSYLAQNVQLSMNLEFKDEDKCVCNF